MLQGTPGKLNQGSALIIAATHGDLATVTAVLAAGVNVNAVTSTGATALHKAARDGYDDIVIALLNAGADANAVTNIGWTPLHEAASNNHANIVTVLIAASANVNVVTSLGFTPLCWAAISGSVDIVSTLINAGTNINTVTNIGWPALCWAALRGNIGVVTALISAGANIDPSSKFENDHKRFIKILTTVLNSMNDRSPVEDNIVNGQIHGRKRSTTDNEVNVINNLSNVVYEQNIQLDSLTDIQKEIFYLCTPVQSNCFNKHFRMYDRFSTPACSPIFIREITTNPSFNSSSCITLLKNARSQSQKQSCVSVSHGMATDVSDEELAEISTSNAQARRKAMRR